MDQFVVGPDFIRLKRLERLERLEDGLRVLGLFRY
jgi:hypothetical protein